MSDQFAEEEVSRREPVFKLPAVILWLLAIMIAVQAVIAFSDEGTALFIIETFGFVPGLYTDAAPTTLGGLARLVWPFVTHGFVHGSWIHLFFNALWLMAVGTPLARRLGTFGFLVFYTLCGAAAVGAHLAANAGSMIAVVGASGAISGCMAAALRIMLAGTARYFLNKNPGIGSLAPLWDRRLLLVTLVWVGINVVTGLGLIQLPGTQGAGIAWEAHIGGFLAGLLLIPLIDRLCGGSTKAYPKL
jgi:membrane associated rhomboid family serine protease